MMVRSVSRSRGCSRCLQRKIKCDERQPMCSPCGRVRKPCPGAYTGVFIVHASEERRVTTRRLEDAEANRQSPRRLLEPSEAPVFEHSIISTFIESFAVAPRQVNPQSWTQYLSSWVSSPTAAWSIRATTLLFYGQKMNNEAFCREADKCYARALQVQQNCVRRHSQTSQNTIKTTRNVPTEQDICASLLLMYYELLKPTTIGSWMTHMRGTVGLLMLSGPEKCQQGSYHLMFRSLRLLMAHVSIRSRLPSCFAASEWCIVPFSQCQKTGVDTLFDIIYNLSSMLKPPNTGQPAEWTARIQMLIDSMVESEKLWAEETPTNQTLWHQPPLRLSESGELDDRLWLGGGDFCSTTASAVYYAVWIMIYHLMLTRAECNPLMRNESIARCSSILDFAHGLFTRSLQDRLNAGSCIQLVFPIEVVSCYSPCEHQKQQARVYLHRLGWVQLSSEPLE